MTEKKKLKQRVRARMEKTGESYTVARRIVGKPAEERESVRPPGPSQQRTGEVTMRFDKDPKEVTLEEAKEWLREKVRGKGARCPCCNRFAKIYRRHLNKAMARALCWLVRESGAERKWVDVPNSAPQWLVRTNQLPTLHYWKLVEQQPNEDPKKKTSGIWRPTVDGVAFVEKRLRVPKSVDLYNDMALKFSNEKILIDEVKDFDYEKMMQTEVGE